MTDQERIRDMYAKGYTPTEIKNETGFITYPTIRKYVSKDDFSPQRPVRRAREGKLDTYKGEIDKMIEGGRGVYHKQRHAAKRIFERLADEHGYAGSYSTVQRYVKQARARSRLAAGKGPFADLDWPAGTMQFDFGQADFEYRCKLARMHYCAMSFPQSNHALAQVYGDEKAACVCQGLKDAFCYR